MKKLKVIAIYDNGGKTADRYTVYFNFVEKNTKPPSYMCMGMDEHPFHPQGIGMHCSGQLGPHNGKRITLEQLPPDCQKAVRNELASETMGADDVDEKAFGPQTGHVKFRMLGGDVNWEKYGGTWISQKLNNGDFDYWLVIEFIDMEEATGEGGDKPLVVSIGAVAPSQVSKENMKSALDCIGYTRTRKIVPDIKVLALYTYGIYAPLWTDSGTDPKALMVAAYQQAQACEMLFGFYMDSPKNRIGQTGWDVIRGQDVREALRKATGKAGLSGDALSFRQAEEGMSGDKPAGRTPTIYDIKAAQPASSYFFTAKTMKFFGQTLKSFGVHWNSEYDCWETRAAMYARGEYGGKPRYMGMSVHYWEPETLKHIIAPAAWQYRKQRNLPEDATVPAELYRRPKE